MLTPGEYVSTPESAARNAAALMAGNEGATLGTVEGGDTYNISVNVSGEGKDTQTLARELASAIRDEIRKIDDRRSFVSGRRGG